MEILTDENLEESAVIMDTFLVEVVTLSPRHPLVSIIQSASLRRTDESPQSSALCLSPLYKKG